MKAKFNQILANFDNEQSQSAQPSSKNLPPSQQQTGYFNGGVPQNNQEPRKGKVNDELIMQPDAPDHTSNPIESFKQRNI